MVSQSTFAGVIVTAYSGSENFRSGFVDYESGSGTPNPNSSTSFVGVGVRWGSFASANYSSGFSGSGQFNMRCVDIYHWMNGGTVTYTVGAGREYLATSYGIEIRRLVASAPQSGLT